MNKKKPTYSISELSEEFGITPRTLRFYEDQKLISPKREGQSRIYSTADRARLAWIMRGKRVGFSIADMAEVLDLYYEEGGKIKQGQITLDACRERIETLEQQKKDIDETIEELKNIIESVEDWMTKQNIKEVGDRKHA
ncbi:MerR family transcriptional regulator [Emcibacter nanhaiensis]|uniref:MerR family DNA-binding transcriptional regulator n=1 Tax=Emcibacter nanhaiensis TaxID=1505037 RepID=A0A501PGS3_9PROT|nr:MerR family DNA-binding transcriptional regulator [Emcibacter nanhaiensis]TPD59232.1 MerR family DNA-binding transcriptional regulator [Emcibacter nanhaiensis]